MAEPYLGEIRLASFDFAPRGWALCQGQVLQISTNQALFTLLGATYGGDGRTTFALPNLQTRVPLHFNPTYPLGTSAGESAHTLTIQEMPLHTHPASAANKSGDNPVPGGRLWGTLANNVGYNGTSTVPLSSKAVSTEGGSQPHENRAPYLVLNFMIALAGVFPSRS